MMCRQFTLSGYTQEQTDAEVLQAIEGGKRKGYDLQFPSPPLTTSQVEGIISADNVKSEDREHLSTSAWLSKNIRERDYLLGSVICTTSRWMVYGQTGLGKTLFVMNIAAAMSVAANTMGWQGKRKCTVMYLDGEMPAETFKERIEQVVALYGSDAQIYGYNRDDLDDEQMPPLNTPEGEAWLWKEIAIVKPDVIVFDSIMCLLGGDMKEEDSWEPVKTMIRRLTSMRIAQIWMHHAGHNAGQAYGTSTRTWEMDTVVRLERLKEGESGFKFSFDKARLRTHENEADFVPRTACLTSDGWQTEETKQTTKKGDLRATLATRFLRELDTLTLHLTESNRRGLDGNPVKTVCIDKIKDEMKRYDVFPTDEKGQLTSNARNTLARAKQDLVDAGKIVIVDGMAWRI